MHLLKEIPLLKLLLPLSGGIFSSYWLKGGHLEIFIVLAILSISAFFIFHITEKLYRSFRKRWMPGIFAYIFLFSVGWVITEITMPSQITKDTQVMAKGIIVSVEERSSEWIRIVLTPKMLNNDSTPLKRGDLWLLMIRGDSSVEKYKMGYELSIKGLLQGPKKPSNPGAFDYGQYLFRQGVAGQIFLDTEDLNITNPNPEWSMQLFSEQIRAKCIKAFSKSGVSGSRLALLNALVLGERKGIDRELNDKFIRSGAIHFLAVSGLHVGIVYLFLNYILGFFFKPSNPLRLTITILFLFLYAFITGFSPSVTRAVIMFSFIQSGKAFSRFINIYNILCLSAFIILLCNPMYLFHTGFWLSHLAVAGIVAFFPVINNMLSFRFILWRWLWSVVSIALAAQITTLPLSLWLFGCFPSYFLLSNLFLLPLVTPVLLLAFIILIVSGIPLISQILGAPLNDMIGFMESIVSFIEALPHSYIINIWVSLPLALVMYLLIFYWYQNYENKNPRLILIITILIASIILSINIQWSIKSRNNMFIVFDAGRESLIEVINKGHCIVFCSPGLEATQRVFIAAGFEKRNIVCHTESYYLNETSSTQAPEVFHIKSGNKSYYLVNGGKGSINKNDSLLADVLVVSGSPIIEMDELVKSIQCKTVVFTSNCPPWKVRNWKNELNEHDILIHDIRTKGAFIDRN